MVKHREDHPFVAGSTMKGHVAKSVFWLAWSRGVVQIASFLTTLMVARILSPADYGLMALASIWTSIMILLADLGLGPAIVQFKDLDESELNTCFWLTMSVALGSYLALYVSAPAIAAWFKKPALSAILRVVALGLPLVAARVVPDGLLRKRLAFDKLSQAEIAAVLTNIPVVLVLAWRGAGVWTLVAGSLVLLLVENIVIFWFVRWRPGLGAGSKRLRDILRFSFATLGARASWAACQQSDTFVLGRVVGDALTLGYYSMAKQLANLPVEKVSVVIHQLAIPVMAGLQTDRTGMRRSFLRTLRFVAALTVPLCLGMAVMADDLVHFALGDKWLPAVPLIRALSLFAMLRSLDVLLPSVLLARYRAVYLFWWTMGALVIMPFAFWAGAASMGALGVALGWLTVYPLIRLWITQVALRELEIRWSTLFRDLRPVIGAALMMGASMIAVRWALPGLTLVDRLTRIALVPTVGTFAYGAGILWLGRPIFNEMAEVIGWILLPRRFGRRSRAELSGSENGDGRSKSSVDRVPIPAGAPENS